MPKDTYSVTCEYANGDKRSFETGDGKMAMREANSNCYEEELGKTVTLMKNGEAIFSEKVKPYEKTSQ